MTLITRAYAEAIAKAREETAREMDKYLTSDGDADRKSLPKKRRAPKKKRANGHHRKV